MTMKITTAAVIFMGSMMLMRADQLVESVQQALKDEGFYYGEVNGDMNANRDCSDSPLSNSQWSAG